jgi:hypothetical protein
LAWWLLFGDLKELVLDLCEEGLGEPEEAGFAEA